MLTTLDGGTLEGGGQIIRNATALAALLGKSIQIDNVRGNRFPPGLKAQHTAGLQLTAQISSAETEGVEKASRSFSFTPHNICAGPYSADPGTAGSTTLLLQIALPCLLFPSTPSPAADASPPISTLTLNGGTNATHAPQADYAQHVLFPFLQRRFNLPPSLSLRIAKRGFYPYGGGMLLATVPGLLQGQTLPAVTLTERGRVTRISGLAYASGRLPKSLPAQMRDAAVAELHRASAEISLLAQQPLTSVETQIDAEHFGRGHEDKAGSGIVLWAETETQCIVGASALGKKGSPAANVGVAAAQELVRNLAHGGCIDEYLQDQIIIFLALAKGASTLRTGPITLHTRTAIWVAETLTDARFRTEQVDSATGQTLLHCEGVGLTGRIAPHEAP